MGTAEGGEEIVQCCLVGQVDHGEAKAPLVFIAIKDVVVANAGIEQVARSDALRIVVVVFRPGRRYLDELGPKLRGQASTIRLQYRRGYRNCWRRTYALTGESRLKLLIGSQRQCGEIVDETYFASSNGSV